MNTGIVLLYATEPLQGDLARAEELAEAYEVHIVIDKIEEDALASLQADHPLISLHTLHWQVSVAFGYWDLAYLDRGNIHAQLDRNPCAWDKALCLNYLEAWSRRLSHIWFLEEDVAIVGGVKTLLNMDVKYADADLVVQQHATPADDPHWGWWKTCATDMHTGNLAHSLVAATRLSSKMLHHVCQFVRKHHKLTLHECLFSSLALQNSMQIATAEELEHIRWHTNVTLEELQATTAARLLHPAKDEAVRESAWAQQTMNSF